MNYFTKEQLEDITNSILSNPVVETLKELYDKYNSDGKTGKELEITPFNNVENKEVQELNQENEVAEALNAPVIDNTAQVPLPNVGNTKESSEQPHNTFNIPVFGGENSIANTPEEPVASSIPSGMDTPSVGPIPNIIETPVVNPIPSVTVGDSAPVAPIPNFINRVPDIPNTEVPAQKHSFEVPSFSVSEVNVPNNSDNNQNLNINNNPFNSPVFGGNLWETPTNGVNNLMQTTDNFNLPEERKLPVEEVKPEANVPFFGGPAEAVNNPIPVQEKPQNYGPTMFGQFEQNYRG